MADRRMLAKSVILFGIYPELSHGAQALYVLLNLSADDDGFVGNPKPLLRQLRCTKTHLQTLLDAGLLLEFPGGAVVITHWRVHNSIRKDRYKPTMFQAEYIQLTLTKNDIYRFLTPEERVSSGCQEDNRPQTQGRRGEVKLAKVNIGEVREGKNAGDQRLSPPELSSSSYTAFENMILEAYRKHCKKMAEFRYLDENTRRKIRRLESMGWTETSVNDAFRLAGECAFLQGDNDRGWKGNLEWLCCDDNLRKVCAGKYQTYHQPAAGSYGCTGLGQAEMEAIQKLLRETGADDS